MTISERKNKILEFLIRQYIKNAEPIGSNLLADYFNFEISSATIRNELAELENEGYLVQPHTSAGRVPTEKGYKFYIENFISEDESVWEPAAGHVRQLEKTYRDRDVFAKMLAKITAEVTGEAAIVIIDEQHIFVNGMANLFAKPEFRDYNYVIKISEIFDQMDSLAESIFSSLSSDLDIYLGRNNPFNNQCGSILMRINLSPTKIGLLGLVGPMRMDYDKNVAVMRGIQEVVNQLN